MTSTILVVGTMRRPTGAVGLRPQSLAEVTHRNCRWVYRPTAFSLPAPCLASRASSLRTLATQVFNDIGQSLVVGALKGFNCCLLAYGQPGSGKSYSFFGYGANRGVVPQVCEEIFKRKTRMESAGRHLDVSFSMVEIYVEQLRDLLSPESKRSLKVRKSVNGTFIEGATTLAVDSYQAIESAMETGSQGRSVGATQLNATSGRGHTVITICFTQTETAVVAAADKSKQVVSEMKMVDLAGSERANATGATGDRLRESAAINKSLLALGNVISALAEQGNDTQAKTTIPYRESKLTQVLQDALGGNSKTIMIAALSP